MMFFVTLIASSRMMPSITRLSFDEFLDAKQYEFELHDARVQRLGGYPREFGQRIDDFGVFRGYFAIVSIARRGQVRRRESRSRNGLDDVRELGGGGVVAAPRRDDVRDDVQMFLLFGNLHDGARDGRVQILRREL